MHIYVFNFYHPFLLLSDSFLVPRNVLAEDGSRPDHVVPVLHEVLAHVIVVNLYFVGHHIYLVVEREVPAAVVFYLCVVEVVDEGLIFFDDRRHIHIEACGRAI